MSDSDDAAFASADEGEVAEKVSDAKDVQEKKAKTPDKLQAEDAKSETAQSSSQKTQSGPAKKGQGRQQQKGKKKGKGGKQMSPKEPAVMKPDTMSKQENPAPSEVKDDVKNSPPREPTTLKSSSSGQETLPEDKSTPKKVPEDVKQVSTSRVASEKSEIKADCATVQAGDVRKSLDSTRMKSPETQTIPEEQRDHHTPQQEAVLHKLEDTAKSSGWGWGGWGSSLLSAASTSVQTFTHQVGDGLNTIMDTVESSLGAPPVEELVKADTEPTQQDKEKAASTEPAQPVVKEPEVAPTKESSIQQAQSEEDKEWDKAGQTAESGDGGWFGSWGMADLAKKVQDTGKSLASKGQNLMTEGFDAVENLAAGGIDVLETIGKKTYSTLSEHDPAFRKTRDYLAAKGNKPNLSSTLKDAKEQAEHRAEEEKENEEARKAHFRTLFDDYQGIAHLEALEMLSNQSEKKVHSLLNSLGSGDLATVKPSLISIKEAFELEEDDAHDADPSKEEDFTSLVGQCVSELKLGTAPDKLNKVHSMVKQWIQDFDSHDSHEDENVKSVHQRSIQALAELTSKGVEQFHKAGELVLMEQDKDKDCTERAHSLARLTGVLCHEVANMSTKFAGCLNRIAEQESEDVTPIVTNVYLEASNSSTYLQDAFQLLLPVLQHAALEHFILGNREQQHS